MSANQSSNSSDEAPEIFSAIALPCGRTLSNRLVKVAMYEHGADFLGGPPNDYHLRLYSAWSTGRWGMIITGNVQVSQSHLTLGRDMIVPRVLTEESLRPYKALAQSVHGLPEAVPSETATHRTLAIMQLSHAGRQSASLLGGRRLFHPPLAPSAVPLGSPKPGTPGMFTRFIYRVLFQTPKEMSESDIDNTVDEFERGARLAQESGFDGVELHASHGYLLASFISPKTNHRHDSYSAEGENALRLLRRIVASIRKTSVAGFVIGVKLNSADYVDSSPTSHDTAKSPGDRALDHVREIAAWGSVDFIEISGGDYENPAFMAQTASRRQAFFAKFSREAFRALERRTCQQRTGSLVQAASPSPSDQAPTSVDLPSPPATPLILLTGGLRAYDMLLSALEHRHAHLLGIGRLSILCPQLPRRLADEYHPGSSDPPASRAPRFLDAPLREPDLETHGLMAALSRIVALPRLIGAGVGMAWYIVAMRRIACGREVDYSMSAMGALVRMWVPYVESVVFVAGGVLLALLTLVLSAASFGAPGGN